VFSNCEVTASVRSKYTTPSPPATLIQRTIFNRKFQFALEFVFLCTEIVNPSVSEIHSCRPHQPQSYFFKAWVIVVREERGAQND
jgi:hypothetical protein